MVSTAIAPLPWAFGGPPATGRLRGQAADFEVEECLSFEPAGTGEHALLRIRKRGENTRWVARQLARLAGVGEREVGYAGLKDRHAVTTQWFTVGLAGKPEPDWRALASESLEILQVTRHHRKLRPGAIMENRFRIRVTEVSGDREALVERLRQVATRGAPNYFGEQRFGRDNDNVDQARALFAGGLRVRDRKLRGLYLSAARSWLFNAVLAARVAARSWDQALPGDVMGLDGRRAVFAVTAPDDTLRTRLAALEIHPTGPLWGRGATMTQGEPKRLEQQVAAVHGELAAGLIQAGLEQERRALRIRVRELQWTLGSAALELRFALPSGSFATAVIREVVDYRSA